jgi:hypothetical protein
MDSGTLVTTTGPVFDPAGKHIGTFNSVRRRESQWTWEDRPRQWLPGVRVREVSAPPKYAKSA